MRAQTPSATHALTAPTPHGPYTASTHCCRKSSTAVHRNPHGPYCLHSLLHIDSSYRPNACPHPLHPRPARPLLPPLTAVHRKFLHASNACGGGGV